MLVQLLLDAFNELTRTFTTILLSKRQNITTVATPICTHVRELFEAMRNTVIDLLLVWIRFCIGFAYTLGNDAGIAFRMASVLAILALHTSRIFEKVPTQCTTHNIVELL